MSNVVRINDNRLLTLTVDKKNAVPINIDIMDEFYLSIRKMIPEGKRQAMRIDDYFKGRRTMLMDAFPTHQSSFKIIYFCPLLFNTVYITSPHFSKVIDLYSYSITADVRENYPKLLLEFNKFKLLINLEDRVSYLEGLSC